MYAKKMSMVVPVFELRVAARTANSNPGQQVEMKGTC